MKQQIEEPTEQELYDGDKYSLVEPGQAPEERLGDKDSH